MDASDPATFAGLAALGAGAGFLSALFGIGGGVLIVPVLVYGAGVELAVATSTALMSMLVHPVLGVYQHNRRGAVDWRIGSLMAAGGALGVAIGLLLLTWLTDAVLKLLFALLLLAAAWRLVVRLPVGPPTQAGTWFLNALGLVAGVASRLFGIGGGLVTVPVLALAGTSMHVAVGSSLVPVFTNAVLASAMSLHAGIDWRPAVPITIGAVAAATFGTRVAHRLDPAPLRRLFAVALGLAAIYIAATSGVV